MNALTAAGRIIRKQVIATKSNPYAFPHERERIHFLTVKRRHSGLSPPEEDELTLLEGREAENDLLLENHEEPFLSPDSDELIRGFLNLTTKEKT